MCDFFFAVLEGLTTKVLFLSAWGSYANVRLLLQADNALENVAKPDIDLYEVWRCGGGHWPGAGCSIGCISGSCVVGLLTVLWTCREGEFILVLSTKSYPMTM